MLAGIKRNIEFLSAGFDYPYLRFIKSVSSVASANARQTLKKGDSIKRSICCSKPLDLSIEENALILPKSYFNIFPL